MASASTAAPSTGRTAAGAAQQQSEGADRGRETASTYRAAKHIPTTTPSATRVTDRMVVGIGRDQQSNEDGERRHRRVPRQHREGEQGSRESERGRRAEAERERSQACAENDDDHHLGRRRSSRPGSANGSERMPIRVVGTASNG